MRIPLPLIPDSAVKSNWFLCFTVCLTIFSALRAEAEPEPGDSIVEPACAAFSADGKYVAISFRPSEGSDPRRRTAAGQVIKVWERTSGKEVRTFSGHDGGSIFVSFLPSGKELVSTGRDGIVRLWDFDKGTEKRWFFAYEQESRGAALFPDGKNLLTFGADKESAFELKLWDLSKGERVQNVKPLRHSIRSMCLSPQGNLAAFFVHPNVPGDVFVQVKDIRQADIRFSLDKTRRLAWFGGGQPFSPNEKHMALLKETDKDVGIAILDAHEGFEKKWVRISAKRDVVEVPFYHYLSERQVLVVLLRSPNERDKSEEGYTKVERQLIGVDIHEGTAKVIGVNRVHSFQFSIFAVSPDGRFILIPRGRYRGRQARDWN